MVLEAEPMGAKRPRIADRRDDPVDAVSQATLGQRASAR
jgi:hypothetical protein